QHAARVHPPGLLSVRVHPDQPVEPALHPAVPGRGQHPVQVVTQRPVGQRQVADQHHGQRGADQIHPVHNRTTPRTTTPSTTNSATVSSTNTRSDTANLSTPFAAAIRPHEPK